MPGIVCLSELHFQAVYFCSGDLSPPEFSHYGLAAPVYTHFTSPIRRYAGRINIFFIFHQFVI